MRKKFLHREKSNPVLLHWHSAPYLEKRARCPLTGCLLFVLLHQFVTRDVMLTVGLDMHFGRSVKTTSCSWRRKYNIKQRAAETRQVSTKSGQRVFELLNCVSCFKAQQHSLVHLAGVHQRVRAPIISKLVDD